MSECVFENIMHSSKTFQIIFDIVTQQQITIRYKSLSVGCLWSRLLWHCRSYIKPNMLVVVSLRLLSCVLCAILFLDLTCWQKMQDLSSWETFFADSSLTLLMLYILLKDAMLVLTKITYCSTHNK